MPKGSSVSERVNIPNEMIRSKNQVDGYTRVVWKDIEGTFKLEDYIRLSNKYGIKYPPSFIEWHKSRHFLDGDFSIVRLPKSNPNEGLTELEDSLSYDIAQDLILEKLVPFGHECNDAGPLVFDYREDKSEPPIRFYELSLLGDLEGLSPVIFSDFNTLLECVLLYNKKGVDAIPEFFEIDPLGAGNPEEGKGYWLMIRDMFSHDE